VVAAADHHQPQPPALEHYGRTRPLTIGAGADPLDACCAEVVEGVQQRLGAVVQSMVVGERHAVDAEQVQRLYCGRRRAEEERLARVGPALAALGDAALEVEHEEIRLVRELDHVFADERFRSLLRGRYSDLPAQHRVAGEAELHAPCVTRSPFPFAAESRRVRLQAGTSERR
jgi:hypothetical protein